MPTVSISRMNGIRVPLSGTTAHARPYLRGTVIEDALRPFVTDTSTGYRAVSGTLQDRVVRLDDNRLCFMYRIFDLRFEMPDTIGIDQNINIAYVYPSPPRLDEIEVDFRVDGLGAVSPQSFIVNGDNLSFEFSRTAQVTPSTLSRFMYILPTAPSVLEYTTEGTVTLSSVHWYVRILNCFKPVVPAASGGAPSPRKKKRK